MATHTPHAATGHAAPPHAKHEFAIIVGVVLASLAFIGVVGFFLNALAT